MNISWNAETYRSDFSFVHEYGADVISLITVPKGSTVIDLGCGNGALTVKLNELGFRTIGLDASEEMLAIARKQYPTLDFRHADAVSFHLAAKADAVFSNAVLHWIDSERQDEMLSNIVSALRTGGEFVAEFGGSGCAESVHAELGRVFSERGLEYRRTFYFPTIGEYATRLENAGFKVEYAILFDRPTKQVGEHGLASWIRMFDKAPFEGISEDLCNEIIKEAEGRLMPKLYKDGSWYVDYVRLRFRAVKL